MQRRVYRHHIYMCAACALFLKCIFEWHTLLNVVHRHEVTLGGNTCAKFASFRIIPPRSRFTAALMGMVLIMGTFVTGSVSAAGSTQLTTCLNLATGDNRVLVRGGCDSVFEMTLVWDQVAADEPVGEFFSARTLAHAVLLNTGGDVSRFNKKDWAQLARLQAVNQSMSTGKVRAQEVTDQEVRAMVTTCVANSTGASRVLVSGQCQKRVETQRVWESLDPPQKPPINDGTPDIPQIEGVTVVGPTSRAVTFKPPVMVGSSPIKSITVIAIPGGQWVTIEGGAGGTALFTGLSPDITYTFLAVAVNDSGAGPRVPSQRTESRPEPSVTPEPIPTPSPSPTPTPSSDSSVGSGSGGTTPVTSVAPGAPTSAVATASSGQASVAFTAPASTGGASITSYTVTSSPGGLFGSGSSSPIVVTSLTNGTPYTFTVTATNSAGTSAASSASASVTPAVTYALGDTGPGGGLVFLISGGLTYEMAPKAWSGAGTPDAGATYCDIMNTNVSGATGTAVGTGAANTAAMAALSYCSSNAAAAVLAYAPAGTSAGQWFLPSKFELTAMYNYSLVGGFNTATYGFVALDSYWSSSQSGALEAWYIYFSDGSWFDMDKDTDMRIRPIRAF